MQLSALEARLEALLNGAACRSADDSLNGLQVAGGPAEIVKVAFAVDASLEAIRRAAAAGAQALFVHHGIFWGKAEPLRGFLRERVAALLGSGMSLFAYHLPLDLQPEFGNNAVLCRMLRLGEIRPFCRYKGLDIGFMGRLDRPIDMDEAVRRVLPFGDRPRLALPFGKPLIESVAVVSGGGAFDLDQAIAAGVDLYVTGEPAHSAYHLAQESGINMICAGHYLTETWGPRTLAEKLAREDGLETFFIDLPTGL